jgi:hypothetical protein
VAVRVGTALRLGQENQQTFSSFELEIRRRLWYCIALMDTHGSLDRGTPPILRRDNLGPAPLLLNDNELSQAAMPKTSSSGFNDMSYFALMLRAMVCQKELLSLPDSAKDGWAARLQLVLSLEKSIEQDYFNVSEDAQPLEKFTEQAAKGIIGSMHLFLRRPTYKQHYRLVPQSDDFDVLEHSTKVLQQDLVIKSAEFAPWAWKSWVKWHALAIVLVELCSQRFGRNHDAAYRIAVQSFDRYSSLIADNETGMLWKPIAKLMRRLQQLRLSDGTLEQASNLLSMHDTVNPIDKVTFDSWTPNRNSYPHADAEAFSNHQDDHAMRVGDEPPINWLLFTQDVEMDYSFNLGDG